ncbi:MAG: coiled-coil domain-containing protein [Fervidobacterium sp.]|uniref:coiled-coil domain-containing protein n=1 Tax=Fervidobacterium sp. TaxID=1871331 RepID=UPI00404B0B89
MKAKKIKVIAIGSLIALVVLGLLFLYGYSNFLTKQIYGEKASPFQAWRNYMSSLFSKIPFVKNFVQYEPIEVLTAREYFEKNYQAYAQALEEKIKELETKEQELNQKEEETKKLFEALKSIEESWKEQRLKEEMDKVKETTSLKRLNDIVETFLNSDAVQLRRLMNAENMSVETLALVFSRLPADTRAEMIQELTAVNPQKAAQVIEKIGGVDQIVSDIEMKIQELESKISELVNFEAQLIDVSGFNKGLVMYLSKLSYDEIWNVISKVSSKPQLVLYILSKVDDQTRVRLLKDIKDKDEKLFIEVLNLGVKF